MSSETIVDTLLICEICSDELVATTGTHGSFLQDLQSRLLKRRVVVIVDHVEADHRIASLEEPLGDVKADEPRVPGDKISHYAGIRLQATICRARREHRLHVVHHGKRLKQAADPFGTQLQKLLVCNCQHDRIVGAAIREG